MSLPLPVATAVLAKLHLTDLFRLAEVSHATYKLVNVELQTRHLRMSARYVPDAAQFWEVLEGLEGVVSGSFALNYLAGDDDWTPGDLDIYVPRQRYREMIRYFKTVAGFKSNPLYDQAKNLRRKAGRAKARGVSLHHGFTGFRPICRYTRSAFVSRYQRYSRCDIFV